MGGTRDGAKQVETFRAGTDAQNLARADGFTKMVDAAGHTEADLKDWLIDWDRSLKTKANSPHGVDEPSVWGSSCSACS